MRDKARVSPTRRPRQDSARHKGTFSNPVVQPHPPSRSFQVRALAQERFLAHLREESTMPSRRTFGCFHPNCGPLPHDRNMGGRVKGKNEHTAVLESFGKTPAI